MHIIEFFGRVLLSALFLVEGFRKITAQENVIMYMEDYGVPGILFLPSAILEILPPGVLEPRAICPIHISNCSRSSEPGVWC